MKLGKTSILGAAVVACVASGAAGQIVGSAHDFSSMGWSGGEICKPCHTPHKAIPGMDRLWNHQLTVATYEMHSGTGTAEVNFDRRSRLCLSCHDGTVALDSFGGQNGTNYIPAKANLGLDLTNDHPVGSDAVYPNGKAWFYNSFKHEDQLPTTLRLQDWTNPQGEAKKVVGCMTCHNPHNKGYPKLLTMSNASSAMCLGCHIK